jgi:monoamine oxidase
MQPSYELLETSGLIDWRIVVQLWAYFTEVEVNMHVTKARAVVIGGGLSGLTAARSLVANGVDDVVVLEAKPQVGGRLLDQSVGHGEFVEGGGEWTGYDHEHARELAAAVGVTQYEPFIAGDSVFESGGDVVRYIGSVPPLSSNAVESLSKVGDRIDELAAWVPAASPWTAPNADELDRCTLGRWLDTSFPDPQARAAMEVRMTLAFALPTERISLLHAAAFFAGAGGWGPYQGRLALRFSGGAQHLATAVAAELGERVYLDAPVKLVDQQSDGHVTVKCEGLSVEAESVVVAVSPADCRTILFVPGLPPARAMLHSSWQGGAQLKIHAVYETPFWRESGLSGSSLSFTAAPFTTFDNTPESGSPGVLGALLTYGSGPLQTEAHSFMFAEPETRRAHILNSLTRRFGPQAAAPVAYVEQAWLGDRFNAGAGYPAPPKLWTAAGGAIREPVGRLHWASTETAERWAGWMEGAVISGIRAADEVAQELRAER